MAIREIIQQISVQCSAGVEQACDSIRRGVLLVGDGCGQAMHDIYSLDGFEKWTKALLANLKFVSLIPSINGVFDVSIRTFEAQKDLYQATKFISASTAYIRPTSAGLTFSLRERDGSFDKVKFLYAIGNWFETAKFLQKNKLVAFPAFSYLANTYGAVKVFGVRLDDIPVLGAVFDKPKEICVFMASFLETRNVYLDVWDAYFRGNRRWEDKMTWEETFKVTSSIGRMLLITFAKRFFNAPWFTLIDTVTQNSGLALFIVKRHLAREKRLRNP